MAILAYGSTFYMKLLQNLCKADICKLITLTVLARYEAKMRQKLQDIHSCNSANKASFQNPTKKHFCPTVHRWAIRPFVEF